MCVAIATAGCATTNSNSVVSVTNLTGDGPSDTILGLAESAGLLAYAFMPQYAAEFALSCAVFQNVVEGQAQAALLRVLRQIWTDADRLQMAAVIVALNILVERSNLDTSVVSDAYAAQVMSALCDGIKQAQTLNVPVGQ